MLKIIVIDQFPLIRIGLSQFIQSHFNQYDVAEFADLKSFICQYADKKPTLVIWGVGEGEIDGDLELLKKMMNRAFPYPIIAYDKVVSAKNALRCLQTGVAGYLCKSDPPVQLLGGMKEVLSGRRYLAQDIKSAILEEHLFNTSQQQDKKRNRLSRKELEIAGYLANGMRVSVIADTLHKSVSTISTFKQQIFRKMDVDNVVQLKQKIEKYS